MTSLRILVVDDNAVIGALIAEMLESIGHDVCGIEATEADAVGAALAKKPDLMIVDAQLGTGSGVAAMAQILHAGPMPHVFISGGGIGPVSPDSVILRKPFMEADLVEAIQRARRAPGS